MYACILCHGAQWELRWFERALRALAQIPKIFSLVLTRARVFTQKCFGADLFERDCDRR